MRCFICNSILETPKFNRLHNDYDPCPKCNDIIANVFNERGKGDEVQHEDIPLDEVEDAVVEVENNDEDE